MGTALVISHRVDFVDNHCLDVAQNRPALIGGEQNVERFRRSNQNVRRSLQHGAPLGHQRVAGADRSADLWHEQPALARHRENFAQRNLKIFLDVVAQRLQRRNIKHFRTVGKIARQCLSHQTINAGKKCSQCLARPGGRGNQSRPSGENVRPAILLRLGRRPETPDEPLRHQRVCPGQRGGKGRHLDIVAGELSFVNCSLWTFWDMGRDDCI